MKFFSIGLGIILALLVLTEISLRFLFGFGNPPLYMEDDEIGYLLVPNQKMRRMGNLISINGYSMRSPTFEEQRSPDTLRIFLIGDSIANGGWWTDDEETISSLIKEEVLNSSVKTGWEKVDVLNASANSWGPRNELAYLEKFGTFEAQVLVLLLNTDDLFTKAPNSEVVGRDRNYPSQQPFGAIPEVIKLISPNPPVQGIDEKGDRVGFNLEAVGKIKEIASKNNAKLIVGLTPLKRELEPSGPKDHELKARTRLKEFTENEQITYIDFLPIFQESQNYDLLYRDSIHLTPKGNQLVTENITQSILKFEQLTIEN